MSAPGADVSLACVILTMGTRPVELRRAVDSALAQDGAPIDVVVVANGCPAPELPAGARAIELPENLGPPAGRNAALPSIAADVVLFLDDDAWYSENTIAEHVRRAFAVDPTLGVLTIRIDDPDGGVGQQRHVPRLGRSDPRQSSDVTTFLFGACAIRRSVFDEVGELAGNFFFNHEESDFAWRVLDAGHRIHYDGSVAVFHPSTEPYRDSAEHHWRNGRNRAWLARRRLPAPLAALHVATWTAVTAARGARSMPRPDQDGVRHSRLWWFRTYLRGVRDGLRTDPGPRRPMRWSTAWRMTRLGRPPVL
jgi:GT2 family glycosyltransferase